MDASSSSGRRARWTLAVGTAAALIALVAVVPRLVAQTPSALPSITAQQLVAKVAAADVPSGSGTVQLSSDLGLPDLGQLASGPAASLLSGEHTARVAWSEPGSERIALFDHLDETDLVRNGKDVWIWQAQPERATHVTLPPSNAKGVERPDITPDAIAKRFLANIDPTTDVSVGTSDRVAGRDAYTLVVTPKSASSLVGHVEISIDAANGLPLRVAVFAKGASKPALDVEFTSLHLSKPAPSEFRFTPPPHATVSQSSSIPSALGPERFGINVRRRAMRFGPAGQPPFPQAPAALRPRVIGTGWDAVFVLPNIGAGGGAVERALQAGTHISGAWGSGRLVRTPLLEALALDNGPVLVGAVDDARLESVAAQPLK